MISLLDERLAEIDERLRSLQSGLAPAGDDGPDDGGPSLPGQPPLPPPTPLRSSTPTDAPVAPDPQAPAGSERIIAQLRELGDAHERLLDLHRDLLSQYAELLAQRAAATATTTAAVSVTAGPFADGEAVRAFERGVRGLPGVSATTTREYLAGDRVAFDVRIDAR